LSWPESIPSFLASFNLFQGLQRISRKEIVSQTCLIVLKGKEAEVAKATRAIRDLNLLKVTKVVAVARDLRLAKAQANLTACRMLLSDARVAHWMDKNCALTLTFQAVAPGSAPIQNASKAFTIAAGASAIPMGIRIAPLDQALAKPPLPLQWKLKVLASEMVLAGMSSLRRLLNLWEQFLHAP